MDSVKGAGDVREEKPDFVVLVEVVEPFGGEKCR